MSPKIASDGNPCDLVGIIIAHHGIEAERKHIFDALGIELGIGEDE